MRKSLLLLLLALFACSPPPQAHAQFIGYVAPQTVQQTLATGLTCTGAAQLFAINNLGQTQHFLNIANVNNATQFQAEIDGIDRQGNVLRISDVLEPSGTGTQFSSGSLYGAGYFPSLQVQITCSPNTATFTASYSGAWATGNGGTGAYLAAQIDKVTFNGVLGTSTATDTIQTPFGSSAGTIYFKYSGTTNTNGTLTVSCITVTGFGGSFLTNGTPTQPLSVSLPSSTIGQVYQVPDIACPFVKISYAGGGTTGTILAEYVFAVPGITNHATTDPCTSGTFPKTTVAAFAGAAQTSQQIAAANGLSIYVCGYQVSQTATAGTVQWVYGTGANCATGTTTLSGAMAVTAAQPFGYGDGEAAVFKVPTAQALCIAATGAGGSVSGIITYIQSP